MTENLNVNALCRLLWFERWWLLLSAILFAALFGVVAFQMTPIYRSSVTVVPVKNSSSTGSLGASLDQIGGLAALVGVNVGGDSSKQESLAVLRSHEFTERFISENMLISKFFYKKWDDKKKSWKVEKNEQPTTNQAYEYFNTQVRSINEDNKTGLVTIGIEWRDPVEAAVWANDLIDRLNAEMSKRAMAQADASLGYLEKELSTTVLVETRQSISRLIESQMQQRMMASVNKEYAFRVVDHAVVADKARPIRPRKLLMIAAGFLLGLIGASLVLLLRSSNNTDRFSLRTP